MICLDTSALMAIVLREPAAAKCVAAITREPEIAISAGTIAEVMIVAGQRGLAVEMRAILQGLPLTVLNVTEDSARRSALAYGSWGKGNHPARLNYGDCFAYELASRMNCPLLYVGDDFAKTDIQSAL